MKRLYFILFISVVATTGCSDHSSNEEPTKTKQMVQTGYAPVNGLKMYYEIHGQGSPLVLIHGGGSTIGTTWGRILPALAKDHQVIAVEMQAHGHTNDRDSPESFEQDADDIATLMAHLKIQKADLMGFSNGGNTVMQVGILHPEIANKLVIISAFYKREGLPKGFYEMMENATLDQMPEHLRKAFLDIEKNDSAALLNMFNKDRMRMIQYKDWPGEDLAKIKAPSLVVSGDKDVASVEHTVEMARHISGSELLILPGNHGSFIGEGETAKSASMIPEMLVAAVSEFLKK